MTLPAAFGRYRPTQELGAGAMGRVYLAVDPLIDRRVAIKVINAQALDPADRAEMLERFRIEVRAAAQCQHPAIVNIFDFADDADAPFLVMEYVPGQSLSALLRQPPDARAAAVPGLVAAMPAVLDGLGVAHAAGVIHRDIKPGNIMVTPQGAAKITDFGIARLGNSALTVVGGMIGTPSYMAPEQALGQPIDPRADLFAAAAVLYEILLGRPPFAGATMAETLLRLTGPQVADPGPLAGTPMGAVLTRGLAKAPDDRFPDAGAFAAALRAALAAPAVAPAAGDATVVAPHMQAALGGPPPSLGTAPPTSFGATLAAAPRFALPPGAGAKAAEALAFTLGPIARILVQKAAAEAPDAEAFIARLCSHVDAAEAPALRRKLTALF